MLICNETRIHSLITEIESREWLALRNSVGFGNNSKMKTKASYPFLEGGYLEHLIVDNVERVEESGSDGFGSLFAAGGVRDVLVLRLVLTQFTIGRVPDELVGVGD